MRTVPEIVKALKYRINQLEVFNERMIELQKEGDRDLLHVFMENEARLNELHILLDYVTNSEGE